MNTGNGIVTGLVGTYNIYITFLANPPAGAMTSGRARSLVAVAVGLISLIVGAVTRVSARRSSGGKGRTGATVALVVGLIGIVLSVVHLATYTGGFGTGSGRAGAIVGLVLALVGITLGGLALARSRRSTSVE